MGEITTNSNNEKLLQIADELFARNHQQQAITIYLDKLKEDGVLPVTSLRNLGFYLIQTGQQAEAISCHKMLLDIEPMQPDIRHNLGYLQLQTGDLNNAIANIQNAIDQDPAQALYHYNLGNCHSTAGNLEQAVSSYQQTIALAPEHADAWSALGSCYSKLKRPGEAQSALEKAVTINPKNPIYSLNLSTHYLALEETESAILMANNAINIAPELTQAHLNIIHSLLLDGNTTKASTATREAILLCPESSELYTELFTILNCEGRFDEAGEAILKAITLNNQNHSALYNLGRHHLANKNFTHGWKYYNFRWTTDDEIWSNPFTQLLNQLPLWLGQKTEQRLLIWPEQGIGDEIMFGSAIHDIFKQASSLTVALDERLIPIYKRSFPKIIKFISKKEAVESLHSFQLQCPIGNAVGYFRQDSHSFKKTAPGYLQANLQRTKALRERLKKPSSKQLIGISWTSKGKKLFNTSKCLDLNSLAKQLNQPELEIVSLQYIDATQEIQALQQKTGIHIQTANVDLYHDLDSLASLISACDLVVTASNINAHMAGALGIPCTVLLPYNCDWRWGREGEQSYWYNSLHLRRQNLPGNWDHALHTLKSELLTLLTSNPNDQKSQANH